MFKVPEKKRLKLPQSHPLHSTEAHGNNGVFAIGKFRVLASDGLGWEHVSVSIPGASRCPTWEEMCKIKDLFWDKEDTVLQYHPAESHYVNYHPYTLHLWRPSYGPLPMPPSMLVGPMKW